MTVKKQMDGKNLKDDSIKKSKNTADIISFLLFRSFSFVPFAQTVER